MKFLSRRDQDRDSFDPRGSSKRVLQTYQDPSPQPTPTPAIRMAPPTRPEGPKVITMQTPDNVIGETLVVTGKIEFQNLLRIDGHFEGDLVGQGSLIIGPTAEVVSNLKGLNEVYVEGVLIGDCTCDKMQIRFGGCVTGNVQCASLGMDPSVVLKGSANVSPRDRGDERKNRPSSRAPRPRPQSRQAPDDTSSASRSGASTSVLSPESSHSRAHPSDDSSSSSSNESMPGLASTSRLGVQLDDTLGTKTQKGPTATRHRPTGSRSSRGGSPMGPTNGLPEASGDKNHKRISSNESTASSRPSGPASTSQRIERVDIVPKMRDSIAMPVRSKAPPQAAK